jgi:hypothetical protein
MKPDMIELIERRGPALSLHLRKLAHKANAASWDIDTALRSLRRAKANGAHGSSPDYAEAEAALVFAFASAILVASEIDGSVWNFKEVQS